MRFLLAAAMVAGLTGPVLGQASVRLTPSSWPGTHFERPPSDAQFLRTYRQQLKPLREEILARRAAEGGDLSEASRAEFQMRLNRINADFRRYVRKQDIFAVDSWGDAVE